MARKKNAKRLAKRPTTHHTSSNQKMEKDFLSTPTKLATQISKEIKALKLKENKLKSAVAKSKSKLKGSETKLKGLKPTTPALKKQHSLLKKNHTKTLQAHSMLEKQLADSAKSIETSAARHTKLVALKKHLAQFEKDWGKNAKQPEAKTAKTYSKPRAMKQLNKINKPKPEVQNPSLPEEQENLRDFFKVDETAETTS